MDIAASASAGGGGGPGGAADVHHSREKYDVFNTMAAWLVDVNTIKILPFQLPTIGPNDVRIRIKAVGICRSDVHYLKTMKCADFEVKEPMVIVHECAGIVGRQSWERGEASGAR
ncbi:sorbitol dehydrogenase-like [Malus sylvestris]|uniref:sorbitol dehydrogenase-like n=1 Tax=Malus domestica TaxID=3750 RepID=UPI0010AB12BF|nr:sorbitol dehydrogenase-like [Malus domestica]XP_050131440.1 sorbitol dehydrogenase-like [Malus sylvestris]